jgi:arginase family enzyme
MHQYKKEVVLVSFQGNGVTFLNFDYTYASQKQLFRFPHEWIDFTDLAHTNLYCEPESLHEIERRIRLRKQKGAVFIGNGNYHYVSYLLIQEIKEPFTLVLFDHHTDVGTGDDPVISCGSWVSYALNHPYLKKVIMIGPKPSQQHLRLSPNITVFSLDRYNISPSMLFSVISTHSVYISIDKDVLRRDDAVTNWDQGTMPLSFLLDCLRHLLLYKKVIGVDVCGEYPQASIDVFNPVCREANRKNEHANRLIIETCFHYASTHPLPA